MKITMRIETKINEKWVDQEGILWMRVLEGAHIDLETLLEDHRLGQELIKHQPVYAIYDASRFFTITPEARDYLNSGVLIQNRKATAVVTNNLAVRLLVNFMNTFKARKSLLKLFPDEKSALHWIRERMLKEGQNSHIGEPQHG